mgnify:CR=1 FL=1
MLKFTVTAEIPATNENIYNAWLDSKQHSEMTNAPAVASSEIGAFFTAHDDYACGKNIELVPYSKIVQSWRTTEFSELEEDSIIEIILEDKGNHTLLTLTHSNLPPHGTYEQGWKDFYFTPMIKYFSTKN